MNCRRGLHTYDRIIKEDSMPKAPVQTKAGRNKEIVAIRNMCMLHRYYYYVRMINLRYDLVLAELQKEFYLTSETIPRIINKEIDTFRDIAKRKMTARQLEKKYPNFNWSYIPPIPKDKPVKSEALRAVRG